MMKTVVMSSTKHSSSRSPYSRFSDCSRILSISDLAARARSVMVRPRSPEAAGLGEDGVGFAVHFLEQEIQALADLASRGQHVLELGRRACAGGPVPRRCRCGRPGRRPPGRGAAVRCRRLAAGLPSFSRRRFWKAGTAPSRISSMRVTSKQIFSQRWPISAAVAAPSRSRNVLSTATASADGVEHGLRYFFTRVPVLRRSPACRESAGRRSGPAGR